MTTDEGTSNNGDNPAATVVEQGEDITSKKDRGVLKVRPQRCVTGGLGVGACGGFMQPIWWTGWG